MSRPPAEAHSRKALHLVLAGLVVLVTCAVFWPGLGGGFLFDDFPNIVENSLLRTGGGGLPAWVAAAFSSPATDLQRPLAMLTFACNIHFTGMDPWWMKLTNLSIHAVNACLVFGLVRTLMHLHGRRDQTAEWAALFAMAAWSLNPINFTPVLLIVQRMEVLSHTFVFSALWLYASGRLAQINGDRGWPRILLAIFIVAPLGVLSKESAALVPLYAFLIEVILLRFRTKGIGSEHRLVMLYAALVVPVLVAAAWVFPRAFGADAYASRQFSLAERLLTEARVLVDYLQWTVVPRLDALSLYHDDYPISRGLLDPPSTLLAVGMLLALATIAWVMRARRPLFSLGLAWFLGGHVLTATILPLELVFEHRNYFASLGLCLSLADMLVLSGLALRWRVPAALAAGFLTFLYAGTTFARAVEWSDPVRLASSEAAKNPSSARAAYDWARTLVVLSEYDPDSPYTAQALVAIDRARRLPGSGILPEQAGLMLASRAGLEPDEQWWPSIYAKLESQPIGPQERGAIATMTRCAVNGDCRFPIDAMMRLFGAALARGPDPEILNIFGDYALNVLSDPEFALRLWTQAIELDPKQAQYRVNIAKLLVYLGRSDEAKVHLEALRAAGRMGQHDVRAKAIEDQIEGQGLNQ